MVGLPSDVSVNWTAKGVVPEVTLVMKLADGSESGVAEVMVKLLLLISLTVGWLKSAL